MTRGEAPICPVMSDGSCEHGWIFCEEEKCALWVKNLRCCAHVAPFSSNGPLVRELRIEVDRLKRQRHELKRQIACRDRRAAGLETCEGCGVWLRPDEQCCDSEGVMLCSTCFGEMINEKAESRSR